VKEVREDVLLLDPGCICCSIRSDLVDLPLAEAKKGYADRFERVLVETTGLADPTPIVATLVRHPELSQFFHLDAVITAVDAQQGASTLRRHDDAVKQVALADDIVFTKLDLSGSDETAGVRSDVTALNPRARFFFAERGLLDWRPLLQWSASTILSRLDDPTYSMPRWPSDDHSSRLVVITRGMASSLLDDLKASLEEILGLGRPGQAVLAPQSLRSHDDRLSP